VQRFASPSDLAAARCTIEEREEYEPHISFGNIVYAGVDYAAILAAAQREAQVILWDGGNNDFPFVRPDAHIVLVDALRVGQESQYHPGEAALRMADIVLIAKSDAARRVDVALLARNVRALNARATIVHGASPIALDQPLQVSGKRVLAIEDGPTVTHGGMPYGAAYLAAVQAGAAEIVDPRPYVSAGLATVYARYPHLGPVLPAMGYSRAELTALRETIMRVPAEVVVIGTPADIATLLDLDRSFVRARYEYAESGTPGLWEAVESLLKSRKLLLS
jgi:predicted GTPase